MILFFDTETTGLPPRGAPIDDPRQPHLVQLAAMLADDDGRVLFAMSEIIRPDGYSVPEQASNVHGITTEIAEAVGLEFAKTTGQELSQDVKNIIDSFFDKGLLENKS